VNLRWLGGLLTNFQTIRKSIERLKTLRAWREDGTLNRLTKKEAARKEKEIGQLEKALMGIIEMDRWPKALYVIDAKREEIAVREANRLGIPVVALVDTNSDPDPIAYPIPGNDDAIRSIKIVTSLLADSILEGHQVYLAGQAAAAPAIEAEPVAPEAAAPETAQAALPAEESPIPVGDEVVEAALKIEVEAVALKKKRVAKAKPKGKE
jgi:small subunit ribosomal protein S2